MNTDIELMLVITTFMIVVVAVVIGCVVNNDKYSQYLEYIIVGGMALHVLVRIVF